MICNVHLDPSLHYYREQVRESEQVDQQEMPSCASSKEYAIQHHTSPQKYSMLASMVGGKCMRDSGPRRGSHVGSYLIRAASLDDDGESLPINDC